MCLESNKGRPKGFILCTQETCTQGTLCLRDLEEAPSLGLALAILAICEINQSLSYVHPSKDNQTFL